LSESSVDSIATPGEFRVDAFVAQGRKEGVRPRVARDFMTF